MFKKSCDFHKYQRKQKNICKTLWRKSHVNLFESRILTVYEIVKASSNKVIYVGQTNSFKRRVSQHKHDATHRPERQYVSTYISKNGGWNQFAIRAIGQTVNQDLADIMEDTAISLEKPCCNIISGGKIGFAMPESSRQKIRAKQQGEDGHNSKLQNHQVLKIRADKRTHAAVAFDYGVSPSMISKIKARKSWKHI